ncbi:MAG: DUF4623 domain-containing protein [Calditrichaeota bacterium]|nr:DUF4623 domain-containing protein [Calditrichota bacterium]
MRRLMSMVLLLQLPALVAAQYPVRWATSRYMNPGSDVTRSLAYRRSSDHVLVATRKWGVGLVALSAATGDSVGALDTQIVAGGTYPINMVAVAEDGTIYASNLCAPLYTPGATVRIYRYADEHAAPELVFDDPLDGGRYGDSFAAIGSGLPRYVYISGMGNQRIAVLRDDGGPTLLLDHYIPLPMPGAARHGISPTAPCGPVWINGADVGFPPPQLIADDGTVIAVVPDTLASRGGTSTILHLVLGSYRLIAVTNAWALSVRCVRYFEDELGTITFDYFGANSDSIPLLYNGTTFINNVNATNSLAYDSRRHSLLTLFGFNSIASLSLDSLLKASTPRSEAMTVSIDGKNDFFPTDHVGRSNGRDMYLTWSAGKLFLGITGHTLVDPTLTNRLYVAFDTDPHGGNGSAVPPEDAGGVAVLPFLADVVYMVESWNQPDYMVGNIYKWQGGGWTHTQFDGNMASQGALAYADDGPGRLAELAAIRNAAGLGSSFTSLSFMAYVAQTGPAGEVLCAFPDANPVGRGVTFNHYFFVDSLRSGIFPTDTTHVRVMSTPTGVNGGSAGPTRLLRHELAQNYPNPFNPKTRIRYVLAHEGEVRLEVFDLQGRLIQKVCEGKQRAGTHQLVFDGGSLASGVYLYRLTVNQQEVATRKMVLVR